MGEVIQFLPWKSKGAYPEGERLPAKEAHLCHAPGCNREAVQTVDAGYAGLTVTYYCDQHAVVVSSDVIPLP